MVGLGGAALGAVTGRRLGRFGLAIACGLAGFAYGALLDFSVMVSYGGEQSLDRYLAISARGLPFNVAHAAGNVVLALAAGPALVRMISRYRDRFEFRWRPAGAAPLGAPGGRWRSRSRFRARADGRVGGRLARERSELRRRIRDRAGGVVERDDDGVGGRSASRPRGAARSTVRNGGATADRLPARGGGRPERGRRPRADDPGARRRRRQLAAFRRPRPARRSFAATSPAAVRCRDRST